MATAWTTPVFCGAAAIQSTAANLNLSSALANFYTASAVNDWNTAFDLTDEDGDVVRLTNWNIAIPGGGASVVTIKLEYQHTRDTSVIAMSWTFGGYGVTFTPLVDTTLPPITYTSDSVTSSVSSIGLSATEIDNLVSNSSSYGITITPNINGYYFMSMRNFKMSFEYNLPAGGVLLGKL